MEIRIPGELFQAEKLASRLVEYFRENVKKKERMGRMIDRIGLESFKQAVLQ